MVSIGNVFPCRLSMDRDSLWNGKRLNTRVYGCWRHFLSSHIFVGDWYYDIVWLQWLQLFCLFAYGGSIAHPSRCKERQEPFVKARFAWSLITMFLYLGMGFGLLTIL